jgi:UDP-2-acetamido-2,6-beta-L-arabino-hexul-4-ose reductase
MRIVITGGDGFIGRNLRTRLSERPGNHVDVVGRTTTSAELDAVLAHADFVVHLAGANRPPNPSDYDAINRGFTATVCAALQRSGRSVPLAFASSTQALLDNPYGESKRAGEAIVRRYGSEAGASVYCLRLTNVFGKWCKPNYNSAVATFCYNIARNLPIAVRDETAPLCLVYIDDVVDTLISLIDKRPPSQSISVQPEYATTVGAVVGMLREFADGRRTGYLARTGTGFGRALYATYVSYLPVQSFDYPLTRHTDVRGMFAEVLKTPDCGQISVFTARPGVVRGGHYHHTKAEKFLVIRGKARFAFRHLLTGETHEILVSGDDSRVVETVPGWVHDVTNVGDEDLAVVLWASETFDPAKPDTVRAAVVA